MRITVNAKELECIEGYTVLELIKQYHLDPERVVVEHNKNILPKKDFAVTTLADGDQLELLQFVGGG